MIKAVQKAAVRPTFDIAKNCPLSNTSKLAMMHFAAALLLSLLVFPALSLEQKRISRDKTVSRLHEWRKFLPILP
jgi:hypothetical protein